MLTSEHPSLPLLAHCCTSWCVNITYGSVDQWDTIGGTVYVSLCTMLTKQDPLIEKQLYSPNRVPKLHREPFKENHNATEYSDILNNSVLPTFW